MASKFKLVVTGTGNRRYSAWIDGYPARFGRASQVDQQIKDMLVVGGLSDNYDRIYYHAGPGPGLPQVYAPGFHFKAAEGQPSKMAAKPIEDSYGTSDCKSTLGSPCPPDPD